ncbi:SNF2 family N-terminal domain-containing protein [Crepidotus variabilis]|uniref:Chromatin-remodeling ATPase INO80 n=1 Tax=Crepidotus variabilis TaxID=179855 RepID=A0A9P6JTM3_9AGAR|nr:SNF2 family N-terminal domain-containing protein [Crepidotus variabilis]
MSLRHILNDEPAPSHSRTPYATSSRTLSSDHVNYNDDARPSPRATSPSQQYVSQQHSRETQGGRSYYVGHQDRGWDSRSADWSTEDHTSYAGEVRRHPYDQDRVVSPIEPPANIPTEEEPEPDAITKKKRKAGQEDAEYQPSKPRRTSNRKTRKGKETRSSAQANEPSSAVNGQKVLEELGPDSSDLEDCRELWKPELDNYVLETKKRQNQVAQYFWSNILDRNSVTALDLSHHYSRRIDSIPMAPPTPPTHYPPPFDDEFETMTANGAKLNGHDQGHRNPYDNGAEDAAMEFEREMMDLPLKTRHGDNKKRPLATDSDFGGEVDHHLVKEDVGAPSTKRRKLENGSAVNGADEPSISLKLSLSKLKGKAKQQREPSQDSVSATTPPKPSRKRTAPKKKTGLGVELEPENSSRPASVLGDVTPAHSRGTSPVPINTSMVYELDEVLPPLRKAKKVDDFTLVKRVKTLEESQKKTWTNIARRDVVKVYKIHTTGYNTRQIQLERIAKLASIQARKPFTKTAKANKDIQAKAKRLMREMQVFWKKNEKEERDVRKREQKEANDRLKVEEEKREAARQARKLEFLISQTELYSHFVGSKLKTAELQGDGEVVPEPIHAAAVEEGEEGIPTTGGLLPEIDFDDEDRTNLHRHARQNAQEAIALAKARAQQFDAQAALERKTNEALRLAKAQAHIHEEKEEVQAEGAPGEASTSTGKAPLVDLDSDELNFQNPTSLMGPLTIGQPKMLMATLKEYQLKGLNWLATLYEQGINGILADEMGLGKTVQSISLLAYLAEAHDIWGPFLVVAPASTLHNWQQELARFVPQLKAIPYWGNVKDRATLRKFWSKKEITYNRDSPFHILITSYQLITQDQQYFQRVKWQYMILDEAQNIKNSASVRWKTLLGFHCRNRLLLTGTPIQNSMQELWALLHFIMPSLFDSHDEFNEWFSKDIENAAENKGSKLNEHQLRRLHMILKPFMLRRVKRHVQNELSEKIEVDIYVDLSARQRALYAALLANVSVADLLEKAANIGDADSARSLMNLVMQFRKVCNHPELFERADVVAPFSFCEFGRPGPLMREGDFVLMPYSTRSPLEYSIPKLLYHDGGMLSVPSENSRNPSHTEALTKMMNIWTTDWIHKSLYHNDSSSFSFLRFLDLPASEAHQIHVSPLMRRQLLAFERETIQTNIRYSSDPDFSPHSTCNHLRIPQSAVLPKPLIVELPEPQSITTSSWRASCLSRPDMKWYSPSVVAPPPAVYCNDRTFVESQTYTRDAPLETLAFYGLPYHLRDSDQAAESYRKIVPVISPAGLASTSPPDQLPMSNMVVPEAKRLIYDSAKLSRLDSLLQELKTGDHRVLIYSQMTKMLDLMEEYLIFRQYKYLRLDGSSKLEDRRDMVIDWQTRPDIFVFLLSTRAGGLGINLTAADTVVFYDHDWNPSNDAQAMDRAHRLGQTRQVTVYRLVTKGTIDERIVQLARVKKDVQDIVVGNKNLTDVTKPSEIVQLLLNDAQLASLGTTNQLAESSNTKEVDDKQKQAVVRDLWNDEGDDFFGHSTGPSAFIQEEPQESAPVVSGRGRGRRGGGAGRGRKTGPRKRGGAANVGMGFDD